MTRKERFLMLDAYMTALLTTVHMDQQDVIKITSERESRKRPWRFIDARAIFCAGK